jgi:membrane protease YdiL (CAAX protease family)
MSDARISGGSILAVAVVFEGGLVALAWGLGHLLDTPPGEQTIFTNTAVPLGVGATVPLFAGLYWILRSPWSVVARLRLVIEEKVVPLFADCSIVGLAVISILAGVGEEALFRGVLQGYVASSLGVIPALLIVSAVFGLVHPVTVAYAVMAGMIGLYLGVLTVWSGTLVPAMLAHALYDFVALTLLVRNERFRVESVAATE